MTTKITIASAVLAAMLFAYPLASFAANEPQVADASQCSQGVKDTKEARASNPDIGPKAAKTFDDLMALAEKRCEQKEFKFADELLQVARGMVASE